MDFESVSQIVFFVLIVAGWVIKAIVEARQAKQRKTAPRPPPAEDVLREDVPRPVHVPRPPPTPPRAPARRPLTSSRGGGDRLGHLGVGLAGRTLDAPGGPTLPGRLLHSSAAAVAHGKQAQRARRASVVGRLTGGQDIAPGRNLTRAGLLWSEILGPCRALRGPHRSPAASRRGCR